MSLSIRQKADRIGGFRFVAVFAMETLARWIPTTPELEAKVLFGRHVWILAQHADQLGRRTGELRAPLQYSHAPTPGYLRVLEQMAGASGTIERISGFYDAFLPDLERRYRDHVAIVDPIDDDPSIRIIEHILLDLARLRRDREAFARERADLAPVDPDWPARLSELAAREERMVEDRPATWAGARSA